MNLHFQFEKDSAAFVLLKKGEIKIDDHLATQ